MTVNAYVKLVEPSNDVSTTVIATEVVFYRELHIAYKPAPGGI